MKSNSVKRVVLTSSISTLTAKDNNGKWKPVVDESCQIQSEHVFKTQASGWVINIFPGSFYCTMLETLEPYANYSGFLASLHLYSIFAFF